MGRFACSAPELVRKRPFAYVMPPSYGTSLRRLAYSGVEVSRLREAQTIEVETYQVTDKRVAIRFTKAISAML